MKKFFEGKITSFSWFYILVAVFLFIYVFCRAWMLGFTHDESITYTILIGRDTFASTANNHLLNTALSFLSSKIFGFSELALRLPNVLSFGLFLYFCHELFVVNSKHKIASILSLSFLLFNQISLDFFGLSRGYGLAMAFFAGSMLYFFRLLKSWNIKYYISFLILSVLTIYSNYSFVYPIIVMHAMLIICIVFMQKLEDRKKTYIMTLSLVAVEAILLIPAMINVLNLKKNGELYFGGVTNFFKDTLSSVVLMVMPDKLFNNQTCYMVHLIVIMVLVGLFYCKKNRELLLMTLLLFGATLFPIILFKIFDIKYPIERSALYWIIFLSLYFKTFIDALLETKNRLVSIVLVSIISIVVMLSSFVFFKNTNLSHTAIWNYDADTHTMLKDLEKCVDKNKKNNLGITWIYEPTINYYKEVRHYDWLNPVNRDGLDSKDYDYYYYSKADSNVFLTYKVIELKGYELSTNRLYKHK